MIIGMESCMGFFKYFKEQAQIINNINVTLPTGSLSSSNNSEGQIPGVRKSSW